MRILLDESIPRRLGPLLIGHSVMTVSKQGWTGIKNGSLLALASQQFDVFITADRNIEYQQNLATLPLAIIVLIAYSNRLEVIKPLVPQIRNELNYLIPKTLRRIGG